MDAYSSTILDEITREKVYREPWGQGQGQQCLEGAIRRRQPTNLIKRCQRGERKKKKSGILEGQKKEVVNR